MKIDRKYIGSLLMLPLLFTGVATAQENFTEQEQNPFGAIVYEDVLDKTIETNLTNALYGQIMGLFVMQNTNATNVLEDQATMTIRGLSTFGTNAPLILIDGIERDISSVTPSEVESVQIITDAVGSARYGVKGANGVVLITTKRGRTGFNAKVSYTSTFDRAFRTPSFVDAQTYATLTNQALGYDGLDKRYTDNEILYYGNGANRELYANVDWMDASLRDWGYTQLASVEFDGGSERIKYFVNLDYSNTEGLLNNTERTTLFNSQLNKVNANLVSNIDVKVTNTTNLKVGVLGRIQEQTRPGVVMGTILANLYNTPAGAFPIQTGTGAWGSTAIYGYNPIAQISDVGTVKAIRRTIYSTMELGQDLSLITEGLSAKVKVGFDNSINYNDNRTRSYAYEVLTPIWEDDTLLGVQRRTYGTQGELGWNSTLNDQDMSNFFSGSVDYKRTFGEHNVDGSLLYEQVSQVRDGQNASRKTQSYMLLANYNYQGRYMASMATNYSGTAVLKEGEQFNLYPAVGLGWLASNEEFLEDNSLISYLKVKTSFGLSGNDLIGHDLFVQTFGESGNNYFFGDANTTYSGIKDGDLAIEHLFIEKSRKFDIGADITLLNSLHISTSYFNERRSNILVAGSATVSGVIGTTVPQLCEGIVDNQGVEFSLNYRGSAGDFKYGVTGNTTYVKSSIVNNNEGFQPEDYLYKVGDGVSQYYGLQNAGFFKDQTDIETWAVQSFGDVKPGDVKYVDTNKDGIIDDNDKVWIGNSTTPNLYYGFNVDLSYKGFSLFAQFQGVAGRSIYLNTSSVQTPLIDNKNISTWYVEDNVAWTPETASTATLPRLTTLTNSNNYQTSDLWLANGNYFKLRNLEFAYTFDKDMLKHMAVKVFVRGTNLFSIDALGYADPENFGVAYPTMQSISVGANLMF